MVKLKVAVVGDVHDQWGLEDEEALQKLGVDLVLFVGDIGNESVEIVSSIASLPISKAVVLGNHDAWYTATSWGKQKAPYDRQKEDRVKQQLEILGECHVGYGKLDFPEFQLSIVGGRPFSWGGPHWKNEEFYRDYYNIHSFTESTQRILQAVEHTTQDSIIFLAHNGPIGLGDKPEDPCGKDWYPVGGDYGDVDLRDAIASVKHKKVPLVAFGHMHHHLRHTKSVLRNTVVNQNDTTYLNAANVPRVIKTDMEVMRNFSIVNLEQGKVNEISLVWVGEDYSVVRNQVLFQAFSC